MSTVRTSLALSCVVCLAGFAFVKRDRTVASLRDGNVLIPTDLKPYNSASLSRLRDRPLGLAFGDATVARFKDARVSQRALNKQSKQDKTSSKSSLVTVENFKPKKKGNGAIELRGIKGFKHENGGLHRIRIKDSNGKPIGYAGSINNTGINEVLPGTYTILSGYKLPVKVQAGKKTIVQLGGVFVAGKGHSVFQIWMLDGKTRVRVRMGLFTPKGHVLLPGKYKVLLGEEFRDVRIVAGKVTQVKTGELQPIGDTWNLFTTDRKRRLHCCTSSKTTIDFFPGTYLVEFGIGNETRVPVVIESGKKTIVNRGGKK